MTEKGTLKEPSDEEIFVRQMMFGRHSLTDEPRYTFVDGHHFTIYGWGSCPYCNGHPYGQEKGDYECDYPWNGPDVCGAYGDIGKAFPDDCPLRKVKYD